MSYQSKFNTINKVRRKEKVAPIIKILVLSHSIATYILSDIT